MVKPNYLKTNKQKELKIENKRLKKQKKAYKKSLLLSQKSNKLMNGVMQLFHDQQQGLQPANTANEQVLAAGKVKLQRKKSDKPPTQKQLDARILFARKTAEARNLYQKGQNPNGYDWKQCMQIAHGKLLEQQNASVPLDVNNVQPQVH